MRFGLVLLGLALLLAPGSPAAPGQLARIQYVIDGDTVVLANGEHVRLVQIDAPELRGPECYGPQARAALRRLAPPARPCASSATRGSTTSTVTAACSATSSGAR